MQDDGVRHEEAAPEQQALANGRPMVPAPEPPEMQAYVARYQELFEFAPDGYLITDAQGVIQEANHAAAALLQTPREFLHGKPLAFYVESRGRPAFYNRLLRLAREIATEHWETCVRPPRGGPRDVAIAVAGFADDEGRPAGFRWLLRDVTAQRALVQALRAEKNFADSLVQMAQTIILVLDDHGRILRANPRLHAVAGWTENDWRGRPWHNLLLADDGAWGRQLVVEALSFGVCWGGIHTLRTRDGGRRPVDWSARALAPASPGGVEAILLMGYDVTDLLEAQQKALQAERLAAIGQVMASLAHESRNALQRSRGCLERLRWRLQGRPPVAHPPGAPDAEACDLLDRALRAQDDLVRLFEDVRAYAAPIRLSPASCDLAEVWREAWEEVRVQYPEIQARLCEQPAEVDRCCRADSFRLRQVFRNILDNAFAAANGAVRVDVACHAAVLGDRPALEVCVRDDGPGLDAQQRQHLFEPFFTTKVKGTGLGLAIARRIVEAHGGQIAAGSNTPPGVEMRILLPREGPDDDKP
jgi:PAS domain S-box-containing protein